MLFPGMVPGRVWRVSYRHSMVRVRLADRRNRSGVTGLSRLTSDSIVYGGPQGWNPHFFRTYMYVLRVT